jgi:hypothetical protein
MATAAAFNRTARMQAGPPLLAPLLAYGALMVTSVILSASSPHLSASPASVLSYDRAHHDTLLVAGCLGFAASIPLAIWTATVYRRMRTGLGITAPGAVISFVGGLLAAGTLALTGLITWTSSQMPTTADASLASVLRDLTFATGSAGFVAPLGLLIAGIAVPSVIIGLLPRPLAWIGLVIAALSVISTFVLLTPVLDFTLPVGRFLGLAWLISASLLLPRSRQELRPSVRRNAGSSAVSIREAKAS